MPPPVQADRGRRGLGELTSPVAGPRARARAWDWPFGVNPTRCQAEALVDAVIHIVRAQAGPDVSGEAVPYIAGWGGPDFGAAQASGHASCSSTAMSSRSRWHLGSSRSRAAGSSALPERPERLASRSPRRWRIGRRAEAATEREAVKTAAGARPTLAAVRRGHWCSRSPMVGRNSDATYRGRRIAPLQRKLMAAASAAWKVLAGLE
jgi:hypothetical protein